MLTRIALFISTLAAAGVLALGISMATGSAVADPVAQAAPDAAGLADTAVTTPQVQIDTVYLPAPIAPETITVHRTVASAGSGEHEDEDEGDEE